MVPSDISIPAATNISTKDRIKQRNLLLLDLASEPSNVSRNCKVLGFSGQCFWEFQRFFRPVKRARLLGHRLLHPPREACHLQAAGQGCPINEHFRGAWFCRAHLAKTYLWSGS